MYNNKIQLYISNIYVYNIKEHEPLKLNTTNMMVTYCIVFRCCCFFANKIFIDSMYAVFKNANFFLKLFIEFYTCFFLNC